MTIILVIEHKRSTAARQTNSCIQYYITIYSFQMCNITVCVTYLDITA